MLVGSAFGGAAGEVGDDFLFDADSCNARIAFGGEDGEDCPGGGGEGYEDGPHAGDIGLWGGRGE